MMNSEKNIYLDTYFTKVIIVVVVDTCMILKKEGIPRYIDFFYVRYYKPGKVDYEEEEEEE